jgi:hypothetical protein
MLITIHICNFYLSIKKRKEEAERERERERGNPQEGNGH